MATKQYLKVVVIDDNQDDLGFFELALKRIETNKEIELVSFTEAATAYKYLETEATRPPSIIILDYNLEGARAMATYKQEGMSQEAMVEIRRSKLASLNFVKMLRQNPRLDRVPVVMYTTCTLQADIEGAYAAGINSYVIKDDNGSPRDFVEEIQSIISYWTDFNVDVYRNA